MYKSNKLLRKIVSVVLVTLFSVLLGISNPPSTQAIVTRDDVDPDSIIDSGDSRPAVGAITTTAPGINFGSGIFINPRAILTAAHLFNLNTPNSEHYLDGTYEIGVSLDPEAGSSGWIGATDLILLQPDSSNWTEEDLALISLSRPLGDNQSLSLLFSEPGLGGTAETIGYGVYGSGTAGPTGIDLRRRIGENVLDFIGTLGDLGFSGFPDQPLLHTDFDDPLRSNPFDDDIFPGDALSNEAAPGPGDSGGPLVLTFGNQRLVCGVMSGGITYYPGQPGSSYGTTSFWQPLYLFPDFIAENNPYKYVSAPEGNGSWTDPAHWVHIMDPGYFILSPDGQLINGLPSGAGGGSTGSASGPGSTGFVPDNTDGIVGVPYENPAQYFDVTFTEDGITTLDNAAIEIDRLTMGGTGAGLVITETGQLTTLLNTTIQTGSIEVNGDLFTSSLFNLGGIFRGNGTVHTSGAVYNIAGIISPGRSVGTMTIDGHFVNSSGGTYLTEMDVDGNDLLIVNGNAGLEGLLFVRALNGYLPEEGSIFEVLSADSITGHFADVGDNLTGILYARTETTGESVFVFIDAGSYEEIAETDNQRSIGAVLDIIREDNFTKFHDFFSEADQVPDEALPSFLDMLIPYPAFFQGLMNSDFSMVFADRFSSRGHELRQGGRRISTESATIHPLMLANNDTSISVFDTHGQGDEMRGDNTLSEDFGMFLAGDFTYGDMQINRESEDFGAGGFTIGLDYRANDNLFFGISGSFEKGRVYSSSCDPLSSEGYALGLYSTAMIGDWFADLYAAYGQIKYDLEREITAPGSSRLAKGSTSADQILAGIRGGYGLDFNRLHFDFSTGLRYAWLDIEGYTETGAGAYNLTVRDRDITSLQGEGKIEVSYDIGLQNAVLTPFLFFVSGLELGDEADEVESYFTIDPGLNSFAVSTDMENDWTTLGCGMKTEFSKRAVMTLRYLTDLGSQETDSSRISAFITFRF